MMVELSYELGDMLGDMQMSKKGVLKVRKLISSEESILQNSLYYIALDPKSHRNHSLFYA